MKYKRVLAIDTESNALDPRYDPNFRMLGLSYCYTEDINRPGSNRAGYHPFSHQTGNVSKELLLSELRGFLARSEAIVFHNAKYDLTVISRALGLDLWECNWYDTLLLQHMIDENLPNKSLDYLGKYHFNEGKEKDQKFDDFIKVFGWGFLPISMVKPYAIQDAKLTLRLFRYLYPLFVREGFDV